MTNLIHFAQIYRTPERSDCYKHIILNITLQSLKFNEKLLMTHYIAILRHQLHNLYIASSGGPNYNLICYNTLLNVILKHAQLSLGDGKVL